MMEKVAINEFKHKEIDLRPARNIRDAASSFTFSFYVAKVEDADKYAVKYEGIHDLALFCRQNAVTFY